MLFHLIAWGRIGDKRWWPCHPGHARGQLCALAMCGHLLSAVMPDHLWCSKFEHICTEELFVYYPCTTVQAIYSLNCLFLYQTVYSLSFVIVANVVYRNTVKHSIHVHHCQINMLHNHSRPVVTIMQTLPQVLQWTNSSKLKKKRKDFFDFMLFAK